jgi:hypothetical protein
MNAIVMQCVAAGLVSGRHVAVDGTKIRANASIKSLEPIVVEVDVDEYLNRLCLKRRQSSTNDASDHPEDKNFRGKRLSNDTHRSTTDPDARLYRKAKGQEAALSYIGNNLNEKKSRVILATKVIQPGVATESDAALAMLDTIADSGMPLSIETVSADKGYGSTSFISALLDRGITPHAPLLADPACEPVPSWRRKTTSPDIYRNRLQKIKDVQTRNHARDSAKTQEYKLSQKLRKRVEHVFAEAKQWHGLDRARCRGLASMQQQAFLTATVQNIKRLVSHYRRKTAKACVSTQKNAAFRCICHMFQSILTQTKVNTSINRFYTLIFRWHSLQSAF